MKGHRATELKCYGQRLLWLCSFVALSLCVTGCATFNPATGRKEFILISTPSEVMLGREFDSQIRAGFKFSEDKEKTARLSMIGQRIAQISDRQDLQYSFYLIDKDEMNAFTIPGGNVYFYTGLYAKLGSDDEVAAVLAHEIGHTAARHVIKKFQAVLGYDLIASIVFSNTQAGVVARMAKLGSDTLASLAMSAYSRQDEYEADRLAVKYMYLAGYDPDAIITTFKVLAADSEGDDNDWLLLRSHPHLKDRIEAVEKEIELVKNRY